MSADDARLGTTIGGYRLERLLGRGGMSSVFLAEHLRLRRKVALKFLAPELAEDERFRERFLRESQLASSLDHPNIVPIYDADEVDGTLYIAMRWVEGIDLRELLRRDSPLDATRAIAIAAQAAAGLDAAHRRGLVHRDVKPGNILIGEDDHVYVSDFGLTKQASSQTGLTATGQLVGTLDYVAPEQIQGQAVDGRTDVYSLSCVVYQSLAGARPFERDAEVAIIWAHMQEPPPALSEKRPDLPRELDALFAKGMAKNPNDRYATCGEFVDALRRELGISSGEIPLPARAEPRRVDRRLLAAALVLVTAAVIGAVLLVTRGGGTSIGPLPLNSVGAIDPKTGRLVTSIPVGQTPVAIAYGLGSVWVANQDDGTVTRINAKTRTVQRTIGLTGTPLSIAVGLGYVWVTTEEGALFKIEPTSNAVSRLPLRFTSARLRDTSGDALNGVAAGRGRVWVLWTGGNEILGVDPASGRVVTRVEDTRYPIAITLGARTLWVGEPNTASSVDASSGAITGSAQIGALPSAGSTTITVGAGAVWAVRRTGDVWKIDPTTTTALRQFTIGPALVHVAAGAGSVWVARPQAGLVSRLNPSTGTVRSIRVGQGAYALAIGDGLVWVSTLKLTAARDLEGFS
jgi:serine/threonine-protein kinase